MLYVRRLPNGTDILYLSTAHGTRVRHMRHARLRILSYVGRLRHGNEKTGLCAFCLQECLYIFLFHTSQCGELHCCLGNKIRSACFGRTVTRGWLFVGSETDIQGNRLSLIRGLATWSVETVDTRGPRAGIIHPPHPLPLSSKRRGPDSRLRLPLLQVSIKVKHDG